MIEVIKMYTLQEVADMVRVSRQSIYNWIRSGRLKATKYGKEYRITEEELKKFLKDGHS